MITLEPKTQITIDNIKVYARLLEISKDKIEIPHISLIAKTKDIKNLSYNNTQLIKNGKILLKCTKTLNLKCT